MKWWDPMKMILVFFMLSFKPASQSLLSPSSRDSSSLLSAIRVLSSAYLRLLIFLPAVLIPAFNSSSQHFARCTLHMLNKQGDSVQPGHSPFPILNQSIVSFPGLIVASWPTYKFLSRQVRWSGIPISFRIFHSLLWSTPSKALA